MSHSSSPSTPGSLTLLVPYSYPSGPSHNPEYKVYSLQPALLKAPYFFEYFHGDLQDSSQIVTLDQTIAEYFDVYEHWLLKSELLLTGKVDEAKDSGPTKQQAKSRYNKLLYCCSLACALGDNVFLDALVTELVYTLRRADSFQSQFTSLLTRERVGKVVADSGVHSGFFKLVAYSYARFATVDDSHFGLLKLQHLLQEPGHAKYG